MPKDMLSVLDPSLYTSWGALFANIVHNHKALQDDRNQMAGAAAKAKEAMDNMDNRKAARALQLAA